jgi:iron(III) transport system substrate-binding protein
MRHQGSRVYVAVMAVFLLMASACGGGDDTASPDGDSPTAVQTDDATEGDATAGDTEGDAAADGEWDQVVADAREEGKVVVYTALNPSTIERLQAAWSEEYPDIELEVLRGTSGELQARIDQERETNADGGDVWITTELGWFEDRVAEDELLQLTGPHAEEWPQEYMEADGHAPVLSMEPFGIIYNTDVVDEAPADYEDLTGPQFENNLTMSDVVATIVTGYYAWIEETRGEDVFVGLAEQNPTIMTGSVPIAQSVAAGEAAGSPYGFPSAVKGLQAEGAPIEYVQPDPALGIPYVGGAFGWSQRPNAAQVFMDWAMSMDAQEPWAADGWSASPLGVESGLDISKIGAWDPSGWDEQRVEEFNARFEELFK